MTLLSRILNKNRMVSISILFIASFLLYNNEQLKIPHYDLLGSKFFPRAVCIFIIILGVILFFAKDDKIQDHKTKAKYSYYSIISFLILSLFYLLALENDLGFLTSSILYVFILTLMLNKYRLKDFLRILFFSLVTCYLIYTFFQNILKLQLP